MDHPTPANKLRAKCHSNLHGIYDKPLSFFTSASFALLEIYFLILKLIGRSEELYMFFRSKLPS